MKAKTNTGPRKPKKYAYIGIRPVGDMEQRLEKIVEAALKRGERKTVSGLVSECVVAQLPALEARYKKAA
jgi:hypothetical protein